MKYTAEQIKDLTLLEWTELMAKELNDKWYRKRYIVAETGQFSHRPYHAVNDLQYFLFEEVNRFDEIDWLIHIGLLNSGRCSLCGDMLTKKPLMYRAASGVNHEVQVCEKCGKKNSIRVCCVDGAPGCKVPKWRSKRRENFLTVLVTLAVLSYIVFLIID